jgi:hypothetical protein
MKTTLHLASLIFFILLVKRKEIKKNVSEIGGNRRKYRQRCMKSCSVKGRNGEGGSGKGMWGGGVGWGAGGNFPN